MSAWPKPPVGPRRAPGNPNGSPQKPRFRRAAPYPNRGDERSEVLKDVLDSYEELEQMQKFTSNVKFEGHKHQPSAKPELRPGNRMETCSPADRRKALYQKFYRQVQEERRPSDCVIISLSNQCLDYPKALSKCLQERGLSVEMLYLHAESGLTRALQDVRAEGSPLCILVEQTNISLSSCTVIIFSESLKIHRNMPKDQAMDLVSAEHSRGLIKERPPRDPADVAAQTSQLLDDYLGREKIERHSMAPETRQLLLLLAEGVHLYPEELETVADYVQIRQDYVQASNVEEERGNMVPQGLGKPPPLLPTPPGPPQLLPGDETRSDHPPSLRPPLLPSPGSYPKTKPPPLLSLHQLPGPSQGGPCLRGGPPSLHGLLNGPPGPRGPLIHNAPLFHPGPRGLNSRGSPPAFKGSRPLLPAPGPLLARLSGSRH